MYYTLLDLEGTYILNTELQKRTTTLDLATVDTLGRIVGQEQRGGGIDGNLIHHPLLQRSFQSFSLYEK